MLLRARIVPAALALFAVVADFAVAAPVAHRPDEVLLVYNEQSPISTAIARDYEVKRGVTQALAIRCADSAVSTDAETIPLADYRRKIEGPVRRYLATHGGINFIVLTKGVPIRVEGGPTGSRDFHTTGNYHPSVDSCLAALDYAMIPGAKTINIIGSGAEGRAWLNRYWYTDVPFTHRAFGGYLVTRLDGYTQADALALVAGALEAERDPASRAGGRVLLDRNPAHGFADKFAQPFAVTSDVPEECHYGTWCADMARADDMLEASCIPVLFDQTPEFHRAPDAPDGLFFVRFERSEFLGRRLRVASIRARLDRRHGGFHQRAHVPADERRPVAAGGPDRPRPDLRQGLLQ